MTLMKAAGICNAIILTTGLCCIVGCATPVGKTKKAETAPRHNEIPIDVVHSESNRPTSIDTPVDRLVVNQEVVHAADLWADSRDEALRKAKELRPDEYQMWLHQKAAQLIKDKIAEMLLYQAATSRIDDSVQKNIDKYVDQEIRKIVTEDHGGVQGNYERYLAQRGQKLDDARKKIRREVLISAHLEEEIRPKVGEPSRAELMEYFEKNRDSWKKEARRSMSLIETRILDRIPRDVTTPSREQMDAARAEAKSQIDAAVLELKNGAAFGDVAKKYSDGSRAPDGGAWGWATPESVTDRYRAAVESLDKLKEGQVSNVIETSDGYFLVRCDKLDPGFEPTFENVQPEIAKSFSQFAFNKLVGDFVDSLAQRATIKPIRLENFHAAVVAAVPTP